MAKQELAYGTSGMEMATSRKIFQKAVLSTLLPLFRAKGFEEWKPKARGGGVPVIHLRRQIEKRRDLMALQFDKYGRSSCFLNLAQIEADEVPTMYEGVLPAEEITTAHLSERYRLRGNSFSGMFKAPMYLRIFGPERSGKVVAEQIVARFPEVEEWFESKRLGKHIQTYRL